MFFHSILSFAACSVGRLAVGSFLEPFVLLELSTDPAMPKDGTLQLHVAPLVVECLLRLFL